METANTERTEAQRTTDELLSAKPATSPVHQPKTVVFGGKVLTREQIELIKNTIAKGASDDELALFIEVCNLTGLNPFARQIYAIKRRTKVEGKQNEWRDAIVHQTSIDGFRLIAERTGDYAGQFAPVYYDAAGNERAIWLDPKKPPYACKLGILKKGIAEPFWGIALWEEFVQKTNNGEVTRMWKEKPTLMLAKCAEALGLRKAFPQELSGLFTDDEMSKADTDGEVIPGSAHVSRTRAKVAEDVTAEVDASGEIVMTFGSFSGRTVSSLTIAEMQTNFITPWADEKREANAVERLGAGFVAAVRAEYGRKSAAAAEENAALAGKLPDKILALMFRERKGEKLSDDDAEELRSFRLDHPDAPGA